MYNYHLIGQILYLLISATFTVKLGQTCFRSGKVFLEHHIEDTAFADKINRLLLTGFYLVNLGFVVLFLSVSPRIGNHEEMLAFIAEKTGLVLVSLALLHFNNLIIIHSVFKKHLINS